jgi:hypothetical protein
VNQGALKKTVSDGFDAPVDDFRAQPVMLEFTTTNAAILSPAATTAARQLAGLPQKLKTVPESVNDLELRQMNYGPNRR